MINEKYSTLVTGYILGTLSDEDIQITRSLIEKGEISPQDIRELQMAFDQLDTLKVPHPGRGLNDRFYKLLNSEKARQKKSISQRLSSMLHDMTILITFPRLAYTFGIFIAGLFIGNLFSPSPSRDLEISKLSDEVSLVREMLMISLLENTSPSERLRAVTIGSEIQPTDNRVIEALLQTLNFDPNVNVRMAAVDALIEHASNPVVRMGLINAISNQVSPIVQIALADAMLTLQENRSVDEFEKLLETNGLDVNVRHKFENTILALK